MRRNLGVIGVVGLLAWPLSGFSMDAAAMAKTVKLGIEYRGNFNYDDHGLEKTTGVTPTKTAEFELVNTKILLEGELAPDTVWKARYLWQTEGKVFAVPEYVFVNRKFNSMFDMDVGRIKILQNGYEGRNAGYDTLIHSLYERFAHPLGGLSHYQSGANFNYNVASSRITLQLVNDVTSEDNLYTDVSKSGEPGNTEYEALANSGVAQNVATAAVVKSTIKQMTLVKDYKSTAHKQPATVLQYWGDFGGVQPLVQYGIYDYTRSTFMSLGIGYVRSNIKAYLDYTSDTRKDTMDNKSTLTNMSFDFAYDLGSIEPFLTYVSTDIKQKTLDMKVNPDSTGMRASDNQSSWALGTYFMKHEKSFRPYFALVGTSGKYAKSFKADMATGLGNGGNFTFASESRSSMSVRLGIAGEL